MSSGFSKVLVTGFCAAHPRLDSTQGSWLEYSSWDAPELRRIFDRSVPQEQSSPEYFGELSGGPAQDELWCERFFSHGVAKLLEASGLWSQSGWNIDPARVGICFSSSKGRPLRWEEDPCTLPLENCDWALRTLSQMTRARGKRLCPVAACAGGAHAIAIGAQWIENGLCDVVLCGAIEPQPASILLAGYQSLGALSSKKKMRPFDVERDGFVPASGAACLILESEERAIKRRASVQGTIAGWSMFNDASSMTGLEPSGESIVRAIAEASKSLDTSAGNIKYVNAHGTATRMNDEVEARAIHQAFEKSTFVSSTKPLTGHLLGAAGAVEAVLCLLAVQQGFAPPNLNLQEQDVNCGINVLREGRAVAIDFALSLNYGFGGHIGVLLLGKL